MPVGFQPVATKVKGFYTPISGSRSTDSFCLIDRIVKTNKSDNGKACSSLDPPAFTLATEHDHYSYYNASISCTFGLLKYIMPCFFKVIKIE